MKILMLTPSYQPIIGGAETVVYNLSKILVKKGVQTGIMTFNMNKKGRCFWKEKSDKVDGIEVVRLQSLNPFTGKLRLFNPWGLFLNAHAVLKPSFSKMLVNYDILHFHNDVDLTFPLFSYFAKKPKIFQFHTLAITQGFYGKIPSRRYILKKIAQLYLSFSEADLERLTELGVPKEKIRILPNGVNTEKFRPRGKYKMNDLILFVGRLVRWKGLHVLIKSLAYIKIPVNLVIIGRNYNDKYFNKILMLIDKEKRREIHNITYLGQVNDQTLVRYYQNASIFVSPMLSPVSSFAVVTLEALSCKTPVVASPVVKPSIGDEPNYVQNYKNGILVPPNDPVRLADAIEYLLENEAIRTKFGDNGREHVIKYFSWDAISKRLCQIYNEILGSR